MVDAMEQQKRISEYGISKKLSLLLLISFEFEYNNEFSCSIHYSPEGVSFEANSLRVEVSKATSNRYAAESMLYLTAGLWDLYTNTNIDTETAIVKVI